MAEYTVESINNACVIVEDNIVQLKQQLITKFTSICQSKDLNIEFKPLNEIGVLLTGDEAKTQSNCKYMYGKYYSIQLKNHADSELFTSMHLNNCLMIFSNGSSLEELFNTCKVPIAIDIKQAAELESCIEDIDTVLGHLDECIGLIDSSFGNLHEFVNSA